MDKPVFTVKRRLGQSPVLTRISLSLVEKVFEPADWTSRFPLLGGGSDNLQFLHIDNKVDEVTSEYEFYVNSEFYKNTQVVENGDVIFVSTSETIEDLGHSVFYNREDKGLIGGEQILLKPKKFINNKFLYYSSKIFLKTLRKFATGVKVFRVNIDDLKTIYIPFPSLIEQEEIVSYLDQQTERIEKSVSIQQIQIEKAKEYQESLINQVVTGQLKVPTLTTEKALN